MYLCDTLGGHVGRLDGEGPTWGGRCCASTGLGSIWVGGRSDVLEKPTDSLARQWGQDVAAAVQKAEKSPLLTLVRDGSGSGYDGGGVQLGRRGRRACLL